LKPALPLLVAVVAVIGSLVPYPIATASAVVLAAALTFTVNRKHVAIGLTLLVVVQDAGLRIDTAPPARQQHARQR
jgi:hypothetical protein